MTYRRETARLGRDDIDLEQLLDGSRRRAILAELGRDVAADRTNLAQSIARVLEHAFEAGVLAGRADPGFDPSDRRGAEGKVVCGVDLPPRVRRMMRRLAQATRDLRTGRVDPFLVWEREHPIPPHAHFVSVRREREAATWGPTTTAAAVRMGLLAKAPGRPGCWTATRRGLTYLTCGMAPEAESAEPAWAWAPVAAP